MMTMTVRAAILRAAIGALVAVAVVSSVAPEPAAAPQTREQHAIVSVLDQQHAPVTGLSPKDFVVREDGIAREILNVSTAAPPTHVVLLVDDSQATDPLTVDLREGLKRFVNVLAASGAAPAVRLTTFGARPTTRVDFTTTVSRVMEGIDRIFPQPGAGGTLLEALIETARDLRTRETGRPVIVAFVAEEGPEFSNDRHTRVAEALREAGAALWSIPLQDRGGQDLSEPGKERAIVIGDVTRQSGGLTLPVLSREGITGAFNTVATALTAQYDVTYGRPETLIPPTRIEVTTRDSAHTVLASQWVRP